MRILRAIWWAAFPLMVCAELEWVPDGTPQSVFGGADRKIRVAFANPTGRTIQTNLRTRLYQASSATAMPLGPARTWKEIEVPPGQTVMESVSLAFPAVNAKTRFLVQWLDTRGRMLGPTEVSVYPTNLLGELEALAGEAPPGLLDPQDRLKPLLLRARIDFDPRFGHSIYGIFATPREVALRLVEDSDIVVLTDPVQGRTLTLPIDQKITEYWDELDAWTRHNRILLTSANIFGVPHRVYVRHFDRAAAHK